MLLLGLLLFAWNLGAPGRAAGVRGNILEGALLEGAEAPQALLRPFALIKGPGGQVEDQEKYIARCYRKGCRKTPRFIFLLPEAFSTYFSWFCVDIRWPDDAGLCN